MKNKLVLSGSRVLINNIFQSIPDNPGEEIVDAIVQNSKLKIERIVSTGQSSPASGWYDQVMDEWVIVLKGKASIAFEDGRKFDVSAGDYLTILAHTRHKVSWTDPDAETVWLAIHY